MAERATMSQGAHGRRPIRSEARGPHWVAWVPDANGKPEGSVVFVGMTREEAEQRALYSSGSSSSSSSNSDGSPRRKI
jgi:hypothetical protein